jgi:hypothetical protein
MKLNKVEDLLADIFSIPENAVDIAKEWLEITNLFTAAIEHADDLLIIQTESERYDGCQPYLQICFEDDRAMTIEAVSNKFLDQPLSIDAQNTMMELGWTLSDEEGLPNYMQFLNKENADSMAIAQLFAKTLRAVYGITPNDTIDIMERDGFWPKDNEEAGYE